LKNEVIANIRCRIAGNFTDKLDFSLTVKELSSQEHRFSAVLSVLPADRRGDSIKEITGPMFSFSYYLFKK
jgi:hypothetical protein